MKCFLIILFYSLVIFTTNYFLINIENLVYSQLLAQESLDIPENVVLDTIENIKYWNKFSVLFSILLFTLKGIIVSSVLFIGLFFEDLHKLIRVGDLFKIAVYSECILVIAGLVKIIVVTAGDFSYDFFVRYYPLSLLSLFDYSEINELFLYPLQLANVFELAYIFLLIYFLKEEIEIPFFKSFKIVGSSYGAALICWVVFIMFFTLNFG